MKTIKNLENLPDFWDRSLPMDNAFIFAITLLIIGFIVGYANGSNWFLNKSIDNDFLAEENINLINENHKLKLQINNLKK